MEIGFKEACPLSRSEKFDLLEHFAVVWVILAVKTGKQKHFMKGCKMATRSCSLFIMQCSLDEEDKRKKSS